jgi:superfamily II DNA or RNA helicase
MITQLTPTKIQLDLTDPQITLVKQALTYTNKTAEGAYQRFKKNRWYAGSHGEEAFYEELDRLKGEIKQCLLFDDLTVYSGLGHTLAKLLGTTIDSKVVYPEPKALPWVKVPEYELYYYQKESVKRLLEVKHGGVELATGLGKSYIILHLIKALGLKTLVLAPSTSIADQLYSSFVYHFGSKRVGKCYDSKKDAKKLITVALPQTLVRLDPTSETYENLSKIDVFIADESHLCPAKTLADVCFGLGADAPYRFFFSATQMRNDGQDMLLDAITGPIVYRMSLKEGVDGGFLAKPIFKMVTVGSVGSCSSAEPNDQTRHHLYYNPKVNETAAFLANNFVEVLNHPVLILVEEIEQFSKLLPYLKHEVGFAHGPLGANKKLIPEKYWESEPNDLVKRFNDGKLPILIGTSCISTGTDIKAVKTMIYLQGGRSEIQIKQAIGRGTRVIKGIKTECNVFDFDVYSNDVTHRHANARREIYNDLYGPIEEVSL